MRWLRLSWPNVAITSAVRCPATGALKVSGKRSGPILYTGEDWKDSIASAFSKKNTVEIKKAHLGRLVHTSESGVHPGWHVDGCSGEGESTRSSETRGAGRNRVVRRDPCLMIWVDVLPDVTMLLGSGDSRCLVRLGKTSIIPVCGAALNHPGGYCYL